MALVLDLQRATEAEDIPSEFQIASWIKAALEEAFAAVEVTVRIVDEPEMTMLNEKYRQKSGPTNVLSFPFEQPEGVDLDVLLLGDIVICAPVVAKEAKSQDKMLMAHWAHMVVHGCLHLLGHDHIKSDEAEKMEALESLILSDLGFPDPYVQEEDSHG